MDCAIDRAKAPRSHRPFAATLLTAGLATLLAGAAHGQSDVAFFKNGDRLTGEIKSLDRGKVSFDTPTTGVINLEWDDIAQLISTTTFELNLVSGDRIYGTLNETTTGDGQIRVQTATETLDLPTQNVVRMTPIKATVIDRIEMKVDLGYSLAKANDLQQTTAGYDLDYRDETRGLSFGIDSATSSSENESSSKRVVTSLNYQRFLEQSNWSPFGVGQIESNDELGIDKRTTLGGGMGRYLRDTNQSRIRFGGGLVRSLEEDVGSTETLKDTEALVGLDIEWFQYDAPELDVTLELQLYRRLSGSKDPRGNVDVNFRWEIFKDFFWGFSVYYTYDGQTESGEESVDYGSFTSLGWKF